MTDRINIMNTEYKDKALEFEYNNNYIQSVKLVIPNATDFVVLESDSFGPLSMGFTINGIKYWDA